MTRIRDLQGERFGKLVVVQRVERPHGIKAGTYWLCECDCGNQSAVWSWSLISGDTRSCGCKKKEATIGYGLSAFNRLLRQYKRHAGKRGISFFLSVDEFKALIDGDCFYCGVEPLQTVKSGSDTGDYVYNGIDRIDSRIGYTTENCASCCHVCNRAKSNLSVEQFLQWIEKINMRKEEICQLIS